MTNFDHIYVNFGVNKTKYTYYKGKSAYVIIGASHAGERVIILTIFFPPFN